MQRNQSDKNQSNPL